MCTFTSLGFEALFSELGHLRGLTLEECDFQFERPLPARRSMKTLVMRFNSAESQSTNLLLMACPELKVIDIEDDGTGGWPEELLNNMCSFCSKLEEIDVQYGEFTPFST